MKLLQCDCSLIWTHAAYTRTVVTAMPRNKTDTFPHSVALCATPAVQPPLYHTTLSLQSTDAPIHLTPPLATLQLTAITSSLQSTDAPIHLTPPLATLQLTVITSYHQSTDAPIHLTPPLATLQLTAIAPYHITQFQQTVTLAK